MNNDIIEWILVPLMVVLPMVLWYASFIMYQKYYTAKERVNENVPNETFGDNKSGGQITGDGFSMRPPFPIEDNSKDETVQFYVKRHNKIVKIFWIWTVFGSAIIIIILNLIKPISK